MILLEYKSAQISLTQNFPVVSLSQCKMAPTGIMEGGDVGGERIYQSKSRQREAVLNSVAGMQGTSSQCAAGRGWQCIWSSWRGCYSGLSSGPLVGAVYMADRRYLTIVV